MSVGGITGIAYVAEAGAAIIAGLAAAFPILRHLKQQRIDDQRLRDAILGVVGIHGLPSSPSVFQQIDDLKRMVGKITQNVEQVTESVDEIRASTRQLTPNGGSSVADTVNRIATTLEEHISHSTQVESDIWAKLQAIEGKEEGDA